MATDENYILTLHPDPERQGVWIEKSTYDLIRRSIIENLRMYGALTSAELGSLVEDHLKHKFDGSTTWYYTAVKLDIEARGEIHRVPDSEPYLKLVN